MDYKLKYLKYKKKYINLKNNEEKYINLKNNEEKYILKYGGGILEDQAKLGLTDDEIVAAIQLEYEMEENKDLIEGLKISLENKVNTDFDNVMEAIKKCDEEIDRRYDNQIKSLTQTIKNDIIYLNELSSLQRKRLDEKEKIRVKLISAHTANALTTIEKEILKSSNIDTSALNKIGEKKYAESKKNRRQLIFAKLAHESNNIKRLISQSKKNEKQKAFSLPEGLLNTYKIQESKPDGSCLLHSINHLLDANPHIGMNKISNLNYFRDELIAFLLHNRHLLTDYTDEFIDEELKCLQDERGWLSTFSLVAFCTINNVSITLHVSIGNDEYYTQEILPLFNTFGYETRHLNGAILMTGGVHFDALLLR